MIKILWAMTIVFFLLMANTCFSGEETKNDELLSTTAKKFSYAMGLDVAKALKKLETRIDFKAFILGAEDGLKGNKTVLTSKELALVKRKIAIVERKKQEERMQALAENNLKKGEEFLRENKNKEGVIVTASGLQYIVEKKGDGDIPKAGDRVRVKYKAMRVDGVVFDSSFKRDKPIILPVNGVIPGWSEALRLMNVGGKYKLFIPAKLAFGNRQVGQHGIIRPNETLIFEVELLGIEKKPKE